MQDWFSSIELFTIYKYLIIQKDCSFLYIHITAVERLSSNVSTTPITEMGCQQCLPLSVVQLKGKHCRNPHCRNVVTDQSSVLPFCPNQTQQVNQSSVSRTKTKQVISA